MRLLIIREWKKTAKSRVWQLIEAATVSFLIFLFYMIKKEWLFEIIRKAKTLPLQCYSLLGLKSETATGNITFFLLFAAMILNVVFVWRASKQLIYSTRTDEENGAVYNICNQWIPLSKVPVLHYFCNFIFQAAGYLLWCLELLLLSLLGGANSIQRLDGVKSILSMAFRGIFVMAFITALTYLLAMPKKERTLWHNSVGAVIVGSLCIGNIYRLKDFILFIISLFGVNAGKWETALRWLDKLFWLSPLSWNNPFAGFSKLQSLLQILICTVGAILCFLLAVRRYSKRDFV